jgi:hypothetical protein
LAFDPIHHDDVRHLKQIEQVSGVRREGNLRLTYLQRDPNFFSQQMQRARVQAILDLLDDQ